MKAIFNFYNFILLYIPSKHGYILKTADSKWVETETSALEACDLLMAGYKSHVTW